MSTPADVPARPGRIAALRDRWGWFLALGLGMLVLGTAAMLLAGVAGVLTVELLGVLAIFGAGAELAAAFRGRGWEGAALHLLLAVLYGAFGAILVLNPVQSELTLTLLIAALFLVSGVGRMLYAVAARFHDWGWALLGGLVTFLLGLMIWQSWPVSGLWVIGTFVGIDLIFRGWAWVSLALHLRRHRPASGGV